jgi:hypothetical protein
MGFAMRRLPLLLTVVLWLHLPLHAEPEPDADWIANAVVENVRTVTCEGLGAAQGVSLRDGRIYLYGDVWDANPRVGVVREYGPDLKPTGRVIWLRRDGKPLLTHPTGLTWHPKWGCFLGDTVKTKSVIYHLDWDRALADGNLDRAVLDVIDDDAAVQGGRPEFVTLAGRPYLATSDYGAAHPEVRLYDPEKMLAAKRTSAPGVVAHRFLCGPFNQNLHWDAEHGRLVLVQNVIVGRGWQLDVLDLVKAVADGRADGPGVRVARHTFLPHDELEGWRPLDDRRSIFVISSREGNVVVGEVRTVAPRKSPAGMGR